MRILRVLARAYASPEGLTDTIHFYERLFGEACQLRIPLPPLGLEIAVVGSMHLLAGTEDKLKPFRPAHATFWVDSVTAADQELRGLGGQPMLGPERGPGGSFMVARHPDGLIVEYIDQSG